MALLENPWPVILLAVLIEGVLAVVLWRTGRGLVLLAMLAVLLLAAALLGLEWLVVTEREVVEQTVHAGAAAMESNDPDRAAAFLAPDNADTERLIRWGMRRVEITRVTITDLEIGEIDRDATPPTTRVEVVARVVFQDRRGQIPYNHRLVDVQLTFERIEGRWRVTGHRWRTNRPPGAP